MDEKRGSGSSIATRRSLLFSGAGVLGGLCLNAPGIASEPPPINAMGPTPEQMQAFLALPAEPIVMMNLLKFRPDGGAAEYAQYGTKIQPLLAKVGAQLVFGGEAIHCLIGNADWDQVGMVRYPQPAALVKMASSQEYQAIHHHREAGLAGQVNYVVKANDPD